MRVSQWKTSGSGVALACMLSLGLLISGNVVAGASKVDICHQEGTSGVYHLISVAVKAYAAHVENHGDGEVGSPVPGNPGYKFDAACNMVPASLCPCDFSAESFLALGPDLVTANCDHVPGTSALLQSDTGDLFLKLPSLGCIVSDDSLPIEQFPVTVEEGLDCEADIVSAAATLGIPCD